MGMLTEMGLGATSGVACEGPADGPPGRPAPLADPGVPGVLAPSTLVVLLIFGVPDATPGGLPGPGLGSGFSPAAIEAARRASSRRRFSLVIRSFSALTSRNCA